MPTLTKVSESYQNEAIECAKLVFSEPGTYKFPHIVNAATDYEFQFVCKTASATTITIQLGDTVKTQAITTSWVRYVIAFPQVTNDNDSLYISFPSGTYYLYNLQMERATTPSGWRPAPEDAEDYADQAAQTAVDNQTQLDIFNKLTNNGTAQGVYLLNGQLYINGEYIAADTISGNKIHGGTISGTQIDIGDGVFAVDENGQVSASNMNITGGTINIDTEGALVANKIALRNTWASEESVTTMSANSFMSQRGADGAYEAIQITDDTISGIKKESGEQIKNAFMLRNTLGAGSLTLYVNGVLSGSLSSTLVLYDTNGTRRVLLDSSGLKFYNSSGTLTKTYSAT